MGADFGFCICCRLGAFSLVDDVNFCGSQRKLFRRPALFHSGGLPLGEWRFRPWVLPPFPPSAPLVCSSENKVRRTFARVRMCDCVGPLGQPWHVSSLLETHRILFRHKAIGAVSPVCVLADRKHAAPAEACACCHVAALGLLSPWSAPPLVRLGSAQSRRAAATGLGLMRSQPPHC